MPLGSSSEAPVIKPGPRTSRNLGPSGGLIAAGDRETSLFTAVSLLAREPQPRAPRLCSRRTEGNTGKPLSSRRRHSFCVNRRYDRRHHRRRRLSAQSRDMDQNSWTIQPAQCDAEGGDAGMRTAPSDDRIPCHPARPSSIRPSPPPMPAAASRIYAAEDVINAKADGGVSSVATLKPRPEIVASEAILPRSPAASTKPATS